MRDFFGNELVGTLPAVTGITIVQGSGADKVMVHVDAPESTWPFQGKLCMTFNAAQGTGELYCAKLWPTIQPTVIGRPVHA